MLKTIKKLVTSTESRLGNHRVTTREDKGDVFRDYYYFDTVICSANMSRKVFKTDDGGWNTNSTNRAISDYRYYYNGLGYVEVFEDKTWFLNYVSPRDMHIKYVQGGQEYDIFLSNFTTEEKDGKKIKTGHMIVQYKDVITYSRDFEYKGPKSFRDYVDSVCFLLCSE